MFNFVACKLNPANDAEEARAATRYLYDFVSISPKRILKRIRRRLGGH